MKSRGSISMLSGLLLLIALAAPTMFLLINKEVLGWIVYPFIFSLLAIEIGLFITRRRLMDDLHRGPKEKVRLQKDRSIRGYAIKSIALYGILYVVSQAAEYLSIVGVSGLTLLWIVPMVAIHVTNYALLSFISSQENDRFDLSVRNAAKGSPLAELIMPQNGDGRRAVWVAEKILLKSLLSTSLLLLMLVPTYGPIDNGEYVFCLILAMFIASLLSVLMIVSELVEALDSETRLSLFALD